MRLPWSRTSERLLSLSSAAFAPQRPIFTVMYSGGFIDPDVALRVESSADKWRLTLDDSSTASVEIVEMPWSRLKDQCVWMGTAALVHTPQCTLDSFIATLKARGCHVRRTLQRDDTMVDFEGRAARYGWPLYYV
jgi:hypothetical protein